MDIKAKRQVAKLISAGALLLIWLITRNYANFWPIYSITSYILTTTEIIWLPTLESTFFRQIANDLSEVSVCQLGPILFALLPSSDSASNHYFGLIIIITLVNMVTVLISDLILFKHSEISNESE
ncbi:hypothetical protein [Lactobacillus sp. ESL0681]|uniref:hypothetical protein n=1 Tax=Lactobacillus sp. ESL0681 TaxID=2983211 RepID=UPI0023F920CF|nr:hypothetical protein [Lactobacillus sp. ESL0681]WEV39927.1 hypothetical protein OZX59_06865 [Lactobacillus sp. ESL0681]